MDKDSPIASEFLEHLACPACDERPGLELTEDRTALSCPVCKRKYPCAEGQILQLVVDDATTKEESQ